jgi:hypothetical protein
MARTSKIPGVALAGLLILGAGWQGGACAAPRSPQADAPRPMATRSDWLAGVKPCLSEDGAHPDQTYPCVWDGPKRGTAGEPGGLTGRVVLYVRGSDAGCPKFEWETMPPGSVCYDVDQWTGETEDEPVYFY